MECLYRFFRSLRARKDFKDCVPGGFWFFQIKKSRNDGRWHPHLHCLISGLYIPHSRLSRIWLEITSNSTVVDIRPIRDPAKASNDAARYAACPGSLAGLPFADALELVECMHGRRICGTWGTARSVSLRAPACPDREKWETVGGWFSVLGLRTTSDQAKAILRAWQNNSTPKGRGRSLLPSLATIVQDETTSSCTSLFARSVPPAPCCRNNLLSLYLPRSVKSSAKPDSIIDAGRLVTGAGKARCSQDSHSRYAWYSLRSWPS
ncbi:hypothetical protein ES703_115247 [subsurface metagenome]